MRDFAPASQLTAVTSPNFAAGLPIAYNAAILEERFSGVEGTALLASRIASGTSTLSKLGLGVTQSYYALLLGIAPAGAGPTALQDAVSTRAADVRQAIEALGPTYVKFGQALGSRPDLIGELLARQLRLLQASRYGLDRVWLGGARTCG